MTGFLVSPGAGRRSVLKELSGKNLGVGSGGGQLARCLLTDRTACRDSAVAEPLTGFSMYRQASETPSELFDELRAKLVHC